MKVAAAATWPTTSTGMVQWSQLERSSSTTPVTFDKLEVRAADLQVINCKSVPSGIPLPPGAPPCESKGTLNFLFHIGARLDHSTRLCIVKVTVAVPAMERQLPIRKLELKLVHLQH
ncbi:hypothetical protein RvY_03262 [Ramazzottius varieornatus]|uniref:Uncharacterized protein n=1 Tax=Ramazzottius varieornatus TaxID=947166 RepID=A0A1D1UQW3_RAMVA|nr:hypothetical protein RvY_03262 [Ramazzottius varieornatus]